MNNYKSKVEEYKEKLKERNLYPNNLFYKEFEQTKEMENLYQSRNNPQLRYELKENNQNIYNSNNNSTLNIKNNFNLNQQDEIKQNQMNDESNNNNIYDMKRKWFNNQLPSRNIGKKATPQIQFNSFANAGKNILNQRYINNNINNIGQNLTRWDIPQNKLYSKSVELNPELNNINNNRIFQENNLLNHSNDKIYENQNKLNNYSNLTPYPLNASYFIKPEIKSEFKIINNLLNELKKNENLENRMIEEWKYNNNIGINQRKEKEMEKNDFNIIYELKRVKRKNMDLENQLIAKAKKLKEGKWLLDDNKIIEKLNYNKYIIEENKNEIDKLKRELKDKEDKIKQLELSTEELENNINMI